MAQQERGLRTRRMVLEAAASVFADQGYAAATIAEILSRAGVTKGALYFHFESKEALLRGVLEEQRAAEPVPRRSSKLQEWVDAGMVLAHRTPLEPLLRAGARLTTDPHTRELFSQGPWVYWIALSVDLLEEARQNGEVLPHVEPTETAELVLSSWLGTQLVSLVTSGPSDLEERVSALFRHVLPSIAVPAVLARLDTAPDRGARVFAEMESMSQVPAAR